MNIFQWNRLRSLLQQVLCFTFAACAIYGVNYCLTPLIVGETRLQVALRPRVYRSTNIADWQADNRYGVSRYAMVNVELRHRIFQMAGRTAALQLLGEPDIREVGAGRQVYFYLITSQFHAPVRSILFPGRFKNNRTWALRIEFDGQRVVGASLTLL